MILFGKFNFLQIVFFIAKMGLLITFFAKILNSNRYRILITCCYLVGMITFFAKILNSNRNRILITCWYLVGIILFVIFNNE